MGSLAGATGSGEATGRDSGGGGDSPEPRVVAERGGKRSAASSPLRQIAAKAHCLLWYAEIEDRGERLHWRLRMSDEDAAQRFLPLDVAPGESFQEPWYRSRLEEDRKRTDEYARVQVRAGLNYQHHFRCRRKDGEIRCLHETVEVEPLGPGRWRAVGVCVDVTDRQLADEALQRKTAHLRLMQAVTAAANQATDLEEALRCCMAQLCAEQPGWMAAHYFLLDEIGCLVDPGVWHLTVPGRFETLRRASLDEFHGQQPRRGMPRRVVESGQPVWIPDVRHDPEFERGSEAVDAGVRATFAFPVLVGSEVVAVLEFFAEETAAPDADFVELAGNLGTQLGRVAERSRAEKARRESDERLRFAYECANAGAWECDVATDRVVWSAEYYALRGIRPDQAEPSYENWFALMHPDDRERVQQEWQQVLADRREAFRFEFRVTHPQQGVRWIADGGRVTYDAAGRPLRMAGINLDVTERKQAEQAQARLAAVLEATPDLAAITTVDGPSLYLNRAGRQMLGVGEEETVWLSHCRSPQMREHVLQHVLPTVLRDGVWSGETSYRRQDGGDVPVHQVVLAHRGPGGEVEFLSTVARDLTEHKQLEEQLRQAQKMEAIGQLAGGVAHEFNNMLAVILGYSEIVLSQTPPDDARRAPVQHIKTAAERAAAVTEQILAFSRRQLLRLEDLHLDEIIDSTEPMLRRLLPEHIQLIMALNANGGCVRADAGQITQVLLNLTLNARDAMAEGGRLTIRTENVQLDESVARTHPGVRPGPYALLEVADTGCGMDAETLTRIFEPFFTTKDVGQGTGLGLSTVYGIVQQLGGHIEVDSAPRQGTVCRIYLKREGGWREDTGDRPSHQLSQGTETVLLVEDEDLVRELACAILSGQGYAVLEARHGSEALRVAAAHAGEIHLLLTDVAMPAMSGPAIAEQLLRLRPRLKVLFISGHAGDLLAHERILARDAAFLQKPFTPDILAREVRAVLD